MKNCAGIAVFASALALTFASQAAAQTTFSHDNTIAITAVGGGEDLLTEGAPGPPVVAIGGAVLGLVPGDHIDALSFGDDTALKTEHQIVFSVDANSIGLGFVGNDVSFEFHVDSAPCAGSAPVPAAACGDIFIQTPAGGSHILAPLGSGYSPGSAAAGDECYAKWAGGNAPGAADDLNAFDYTAPADAAGIYFSLAPGSPTLAAIAATPGDILYSDLSGAAPVIATLGGGAGLATAANLGIVLHDLDALSLVGTTGSVGGGGGVISAGAVGPAPANTGVVSTHFLEFSVIRGGGAVGSAGDVLVRAGAGVAAVFVPAEGLGLAIVDEDELNALEVDVSPPIIPVDQNRHVGTENVNAPQCTDDYFFDEDAADGFEPFDGLVETHHDCDSGVAFASAAQQSQIGAASMIGSGIATSQAHGPIPSMVHAFGHSRFSVSFELPLLSKFTVEGAISASAFDDPEVGVFSRIKLVGPGEEVVFEHTVEPGGGGETSSQVIEEVGLLQPGVYMLEARSGTFIKNAVPPSRFAQASFDFTFEVATACPADLYGDGVVGVPDLIILLAAWGPNPGHPADFDGDGQVRVPDLIALLAKWGVCP